MHPLLRIRRLVRTVAFRTGLIRFYWQWRHVVDGSYRAAPPSLIAQDAHRVRLCELIAALDAQSCVEVGCADGPNLSILASRLPRCTLSAVDLNRHALRMATERVLAIGGSIGVMRRGTADRLPFESQSFDVALSDAVFMYLTPPTAELAIREMRRVARRAMIIHTFADDDLAHGQLQEGNWVHPVGRLLSSIVAGAHVHKERSLLTNGQWGRYGTIYHVTW